MMRPAWIALPLVLATIACGSSTDVTLTPTTEILTGTVNAPVNGTLQSDTKTFTVGQKSEADITLTSAVETLPGGQLLSTVTMGLTVGTWSGSTCTPTFGANAAAPASSAILISGIVNAGMYCVIVSDVTTQLGPVAYSVTVAHF
jgi:hypothetical protein